MKRLCLIASVAVVTFLLMPVASPSNSMEEDSVGEQARRVHFSSIVLDTHIDVTPKLQTAWKFTEEHKEGHIDLPRMKKGGLNALFFSIYIDHAVKVAGVDHVGLGSDFDGGSMPVGMEDCTQLPKITEALMRKGYSASDMRKILGENTLRLLSDVERVSKQLRATK